MLDLMIPPIVAGLVVAATGTYWYPTAEEMLYGHALTRIPELYLPYWPFEPWFGLFLIGLGAYALAGRLPR